MRALTWHVRDGLREGSQIDEQRRERLLAVLWREQPDVVALQELSGWTLELLRELGEETDLPHVRLFRAPSGEHHQALLSKTPLSAARSLLETSTSDHGAYAAETRDLTVVTAHLSTSSFAERRVEAFELVRSLPRERTLVLGDLAEVRREERTSALDAALPEDLQARLSPARDASAVDVLVAAGFVDAGEGSSLGTAMERGRDGELSLVLRLDYALHTPGVEVRELRVLDDDEVRSLSNHLPVIVDVAL